MSERGLDEQQLAMLKDKFVGESAPGNVSLATPDDLQLVWNLLNRFRFPPAPVAVTSLDANG